MEKETSAGVIIFYKNKEILYLLLQYGAGHWGFVKGNIEKGEDEKETLAREAKEEAGLSDLEIVEGFKHKESYFYKRDGKLISKEVIFYLAKTKTKAVKLSYEHKDFKWLNFNDAVKQLTFRDEKELLRKANEFLTNKKITSQKDLKDF